MLLPLLLVVCAADLAAASYPKATVLYTDPKDFASEAKCCMGAFNTVHSYRGKYLVSALYLSSHVRNYETGTQSPEAQDIGVTMSELLPGGSWQVVARATYTDTAAPTQLLRMPISYSTDSAAKYLFEIHYGGPYTYGTYNYKDTSIGPINEPSSFILGVDYEKQSE